MTTNRSKVPGLRFPHYNGVWALTRLGNLVDVINGLTYSPTNICDDGLLVLRSSNVKGSNIELLDNVYVDLDVESEKITRIGDILLCVRNGSRRLIGKSAMIKKNIPRATHGAFMSLLRGDFNDFVFQLFQTQAYFKEVHKNLGATINSINGSDLKKFSFYLPAERDEQQKIASFLSSVDTKIEQLRSNKALLEQYKKGIMQKIFSQEIRFNDDGKNYPDMKEVKLSEITKGYREKTISENQFDVLTSSLRGLMLQTEYYGQENRITSRSNIGFNILPPRYITYRSRSDNGKFHFNVNNFSFSGAVSSYYPVFKAIEEFSTKYLCEALNFNWKKFSRLSVGTSQKVLSYKDLHSSKLKLHSPAEQQKIGKFLSAIDRKIELVGTQLDQAKTFKKGLLQQMFI